MTLARVFLEALHCTGAPIRVFGTGGLRPTGIEALPPCEGGTVDVLVFAPSASECRKRGWLTAAVDRAVSVMARNGLLYVVAPQWWRWRILRGLSRHGLQIGHPILHLRAGAARYYVPLKADMVQFAVATWSLSDRWRRVSLVLRAISPSSRALALALPGIGFAASRRGTLPFGWLTRHLGDCTRASAIVSTSWRGADGAAVIFGFDGARPHPSVTAKRAATYYRPQESREAGLLQTLGPAAAQAGMDVPQVIDPAAADRWLVETALAGRPLWRMLAEGEATLPETMAILTAWLGRWNRQTLRLVELTPALCEQELLGPARRLASEISHGSDYLSMLEAASLKLVGQRVATVATHNDLTMANLLMRPDRRMGLVDWEAARPDGLPLSDFWYAACDAVAALDSYRDRRGAFDQCFADGGRHRQLLLRQENRLRENPGSDDRWIELSFHGCWLQHAANEQARCRPGDERPFLSIANGLASRALSCEAPVGPVS